MLTTVPIVGTIEGYAGRVEGDETPDPPGFASPQGSCHIKGREPTTRALERRPEVTALRRNAEGATWRDPMRALRVEGVAEARTPVMETVMAAISSVRRLGREEERVLNRSWVHE